MNDHASRIKTVEVQSALLPDSGTIPNNPRLPLLLYKQAVDLPAEGAPELFEDVFTANGWPAAWRSGIHEFHHYHSTAHEALGVYAGSATALLGGEGGIEVTVEAGGRGDHSGGSGPQVSAEERRPGDCRRLPVEYRTRSHEGRAARAPRVYRCHRQGCDPGARPTVRRRRTDG